MKIAYLGKILMEPIKPSWYIGKIMTYQAGISNRAADIDNGIPSDDTYYPVEWSDSVVIGNIAVLSTSNNGVVTYLQSKDHPSIWIRLDDKMSISEG